MKVYVFYINNDTSPYAYTINREYSRLFKTQRNMSVFHYKTIHLDKYEYMIFANRYQNIQLITDYLFDGENDIEIVSTVNESDKLSESCDYIINTTTSLEKSFNSLPLKRKYLKSIINITEELKKCDDKSPTLLINTFALFYHLFRNTFSDIEIEE